MAEPILDTMLELERQVWEALVVGDPSSDAALLAEDFLGVYSTGFGDREEHVGQLSDGPTVAEYRLSDARVLVLSDDLVLLAYHTAYRRVGQDVGTPLEKMYVSSLWRREAGGWINLFSQDTDAGGARPV